MNFEYSEKSKELQQRLISFIEAHIVPIESEYITFQSDTKNNWTRFPKLEMLKQKAKDAGLWNLFLPKEYGNLSPGLSNLEYAPLAEISFKPGLLVRAAPGAGGQNERTYHGEVLATY